MRTHIAVITILLPFFPSWLSGLGFPKNSLQLKASFCLNAKLALTMPKFSFLSSYLLFSLLFLFFFPILSQPDSSSVLRLPSETNFDLCAGTSKPSTCPVNCFRTDPVCGVDGITYWCGCADAMCAGTRVAKLGFCEVGSGGSGPVSGQAFLLVHIVWLIVLGFSVLLGFF